MIYDSEEFRALVLKLITDKKFRHSCYEECCTHAEDMAVHVYGDKPTKILERVRPREDPAIKDYRLESWEPITKSTASKGLSIVGKMANPSLYNVRPGETSQGKGLYEYAMEDYPGFKSVVNYFFETGLQKMIADPNAVFAIRPQVFPESDVERVKPIIKLYGSKNIWHFDVDHYLIFLREERTDKGLELYFFEYYDKDQLIEFRAYTVNTKTVEIDEERTYKLGFQKVPVWNLKGLVETLDDGTIIYKSFFDAAAPYWNQVINHWSDMVGAFIQHIHPLRVEASVACDYIDGNQQRCARGVLVDPVSGSRTPCPSCGGSGVKGMLNSPYGLIRVNVDAYKNEATGNTSGIAPVSFVTVPTEATQMLKDHCKELLEMGLNSLNMDIVNRIGENQSGRAKVIDRGELYDFLYKIASVVFDTHIYNFFYFFNAYLYGVEASSKGQTSIDTNMPTISKPVQFDISTAQELLAEFEQAKKAGADPNYLKVKQKEINGKEFATNPDLRDKMNLILDLDPLPALPIDDLIAQSGQGWVDEIDLIIHSNIGKFVDRALIEKEKAFLKMPTDKKYELLRAYAEELKAANKDRIEVPEPKEEVPAT